MAAKDRCRSIRPPLHESERTTGQAELNTSHRVSTIESESDRSKRAVISRTRNPITVQTHVEKRNPPIAAYEGLTGRVGQNGDGNHENMEGVRGQDDQGYTREKRISISAESVNKLKGRGKMSFFNHVGRRMQWCLYSVSADNKCVRPLISREIC